MQIYSISIANSLILMDNKEFKRSSYQRVYQYLRRYSAGKNLDNFSFVGAEEEGSAEDCLELFLE